MKDQIIYVCNECGGESFKWSGKCDECGAWNSLKEIREPKSISSNSSKVEPATVHNFSEMKFDDIKRVITGFSEFDRVLGGGIVPGSVVLLGGDPGIGKSTLALQLAVNLNDVCYVSGEESVEQVSLRYHRIKKQKKIESNNIIAENNFESIEKTILKIKPKIIIIDSIQTMYIPSFPSAQGSVVQVRENAIRIVRLAKKNNIAAIIIGHVTKDGDIAGPRILEHMVDVVLYLEGERYHDLRILRGLKNRFGDSSEIGIFRMESSGLIELPNPSLELLSERVGGAGSVVTSTIEGTRPLLVEVQALVNQSLYGYPRRTTSGFDLNRLNLLLAILKKFNFNLNSHDVYINIVGGFKLREPAVDLAVAVAIASALKNIEIDRLLCVYGELGLSGEIRKVSYQNKREVEAKRLGYETLPSTRSLNDLLKTLFSKD